MFPLLAKEYHLDQTQAGLLTGVCVLALGYSNFVIVPFSNIFGRRAALVLFGVITCASTAWEALAKSHGSLLGARVINGIGTATSESIMVQVIADVFFLHERGLWMGVYLCVLEDSLWKLWLTFAAAHRTSWACSLALLSRGTLRKGEHDALQRAAACFNSN
jgi:MFS family permease